jgi:predicted phosphodiesterase
MKNIKYIISILIPVLMLAQPSSLKINTKDFAFAVLGDRTGDANQPIFEEVIKRVESINPDFVINVGDLIEGYSDNEATINSEWDSIFIDIDKLKNKFYFTAGNHDSYDSLNRVIYLNRIGYKTPYYNFSYGKNHFIVLDNSQQEKIDKPDTMQIHWLAVTLAQFKKNDNIYCFMHRSYWKDAYANNKPDTFHKLFIKYGVDYVFSGHDHFYCQLNWDGITYTQVGPSGSRYKVYFQEEFGAFQNFVMVSVKNNKASIKVITPDGTELSADCVTYDDIQELKTINQAITMTPVKVGRNDSMSVMIKNIFDLPISTKCSWSVEKTNWQIIPDGQAVIIPGQVTYQYNYHASLGGENVYPLPRYHLNYPYKSGEKIYSYEQILPVKLEADCYNTNKPVKIDGKLNEKIWQSNKPINIFGAGDGGASPTDPWEVIFVYDKSNLYIGARMTDFEPDKISTTVMERDDKVYNDDHINIILQPSVGSDTYYQFFVNSNGVVLDRACYMQGNYSKKDAQWNCDITAKGEIVTGEKFNGWTLEIAIPLKDFGILDPERVSGHTWGFNLVRFQNRKSTVSEFSVPFEHNPKTFALLNFMPGK